MVGEPEQLLVSAWLTGLQSARPERGAVEEVPGVLRWADLQNEESNGDGDDRIAQCDDPCGITLGRARLTARLPSRGNP